VWLLRGCKRQLILWIAGGGERRSLKVACLEAPGARDVGPVVQEPRDGVLALAVVAPQRKHHRPLHACAPAAHVPRGQSGACAARSQWLVLLDCADALLAPLLPRIAPSAHVL